MHCRCRVRDPDASVSDLARDATSETNLRGGGASPAPAQLIAQFVSSPAIYYSIESNLHTFANAVNNAERQSFLDV
jgi:hypothetical protein